jgi:hypothetical protein
MGGQPIRDLPDPRYGEQTEHRAIQKAAPLADASAPAGPAVDPMALAGAVDEPPAELTEGGMDQPGMPGMFDDGDPDVPMTAGAPLGAGPAEIDGLPPGMGGEFRPRALREALEPYVVSDQTGILDDIVGQLQERGLW